MEFEWDEAKRLSNIATHGLDFEDAINLLDGPHLLSPTHPGSDAERLIAVGQVAGRFVTLVFTPRGSVIRVISLRRSRDGEIKQYRALYG